LVNLKERDHFKDLCIDRRIILELTLEKMVARCGPVSSCSGQGPVGGCCEHGNETLGSIKGGEFFD